MEPHLKVWFEQGGRLTLSDYRVRLLRQIRDTGSLAQAAAAMHLSYRRAWGKVRELEQNLGITLVRSGAGGAGGGGSRLTNEAERLLTSYEAFATELAAATRTLHRKHFGWMMAHQASRDEFGSGERIEQVQPIADNSMNAP